MNPFTIEEDKTTLNNKVVNNFNFNINDFMAVNTIENFNTL